MKEHWTERMFIKNSSLFRVSLEKAAERASIEVAGLEKIFLEFGVPRNGLILDLCCGIGRHSVLLAEKGFRVIGVDISPEYVAHAKKLAVDKKVNDNVEFRVGDMRQIKTILHSYEEKFNAVINLFTSIGYYDEETDIYIFKQLLALTAPNGILVIDTVNRDWLIRHFQARDIVDIDDELVLVEERKLNLENSRMENVWKYYKRQGKDLKFLETFEINLRVYSLHELKRMLESVGWIYQTCYGNFNLEPLKMDSNRIIVVAKKT